MHEMGIADQIIRIVESEAASHPGAHINAVGLRIGEFSGIDTESLSFCFECLTKDTALESASLRIEHTAAGELEVAFLEMEVP